MYRCNDCESEFEKPRHLFEFVGEVEKRGIQVFHFCPVCGEDDIAEMENCELCGTDIPPKDDYCLPCQAMVSEWMQDAIKQIKTDTGADRAAILRAFDAWAEGQ